MASPIWHIQNCLLFQKLAPEQLDRLEQVSRVRQLQAKVPIYLPADVADSIFILASGRAKICHLTPDGKQSILGFIEPGELFGELSLVAPGRREEYAETVERSLLVMIPGDIVGELMESQPTLALGITRLIGLRRKRIESRLKNLLFLSSRERLTHLLLELAERYGQEEGDAIRIGIRLSHQDLANIIGSTRETVTVVLGELQAERLVRIGRRRIELLNTARLAESVQREEPTLPQPTSPSVSSLM